jgi:KTSC domain
MEWIAVESSAISALGYETGQRRLGIEFRESRLVYFYYAVPRWEFEDFLKAESKGRYLTQVFLSKQYRYSGPYPSRTQAA